MRVLQRIVNRSALWALAAVVSLIGIASASEPESMVSLKQTRDGTRMMRGEIEVAADLDVVWALWTTSEGVTKLFPPKADIELKVGGKYEWYFNPDAPPGSRGSEGCKVLSFIPKRMFSFSWNAPPSIPALREAGAQTYVVVEFDQLAPKRTRVVFTQLGFGEGPDWDKYYDYFDTAWLKVLGGMMKRFEPAAPAAEAEEVDPDAKPRRWIYLLQPAREGFNKEPTQAEIKYVEEHFVYLQKLARERVVLLAGRCIGNAVEPMAAAGMIKLEAPPYGIVIFEADHQGQAKWIMENDPAVRSGVFKAILYSFNLPMMRGVVGP